MTDALFVLIPLYMSDLKMRRGQHRMIKNLYGLGEYIDQHQAELDKNPEVFFTQLIQEYYQLTEEGRGQSFWQPTLFTPYKEGTADFNEWNDDFLDDEIDLIAIIQLTDNPEPDFLQLFYRYGFPDHLYICASDPCPENPTLFGTDHEFFFKEVTHEGYLEDFLNRCITPTELIEIIKQKMNL